MTAYRITIHVGDEPAEGLERHPSFRAARMSAIRSAIAILLDRASYDDFLATTFEVRDEHAAITHAFELVVQVRRLPSSG